MKFPEFSKGVVSNLLMFRDHFESFDWTLISFRSSLPAVGGTGEERLLPNSFSRLLSNESGKGALFAARKLFLVLSVVGCQRSVVTINSRHSIENEIPGSATRIAVDVQILVFYATNYGQRTTSTDFWFGSSLPTFRRTTLGPRFWVLIEGSRHALAARDGGNGSPERGRRGRGRP